jgi:hypothetical protein
MRVTASACGFSLFTPVFWMEDESNSQLEYLLAALSSPVFKMEDESNSQRLWIFALYPCFLDGG